MSLSSSFIILFSSIYFSWLRNRKRNLSVNLWKNICQMWYCVNYLHYYTSTCRNLQNCHESSKELRFFAFHDLFRKVYISTIFMYTVIYLILHQEQGLYWDSWGPQRLLSDSKHRKNKNSKSADLMVTYRMFNLRFVLPVCCIDV